MNDVIDRAAEVLGDALGSSYSHAVRRMIARRLDAAGLLVTPKHNAAVAAKALREAADAIDALPSKRGRAVYGHERELADGQDIGIEYSADALRARADRIETEGDRP